VERQFAKELCRGGGGVFSPFVQKEKKSPMQIVFGEEKGSRSNHPDMILGFQLPKMITGGEETPRKKKKDWGAGGESAS